MINEERKVTIPPQCIRKVKCVDVTQTSFKLQNSFQTGRLIMLCCQPKMINHCRKFMMPHHPDLTMKTFTKSGSTQCILITKMFWKTKNKTFAKQELLNWKFQQYLRGDYETKNPTHSKTPLALPQHSSKGRVSGFAEQRKPDDSEKAMSLHSNPYF